MAVDDLVDSSLPDRDEAKEFYAKYEPKEALGRCLESKTSLMGKESFDQTDKIICEKLSNGHTSVPKELQHLLKTKDKFYHKYSTEFGCSRYKLEEILGVCLESKTSLMGKESFDQTDKIICEKLSNGHTSVPKELQHLLKTKDKFYHKYSTEFGCSRYKLEEILGVGISSIVRRCVNKDTGNEYAVKIIDISGEKAEDCHTDQTKWETLREINILKMCKDHPNIIHLHDSFQTPTFIFLVFELCKRGELFDYLTQVVTLSEKRTRIVMKQLLEAVEFIHEKSIVHRDLKPENILLDDNLNIKLSDFGFAAVLGPKEELTELCGTPGYLAPEVLAVSMYEGVSGYRHEVDMWAIGVIMYTLLCGAPPFWHRKQMQMLRMIMQANYSFSSPEWDDISQAPKDLISKLLVIEPKERLTASQALAHPFFKRELKPEKVFYPKKVFRAAVLCVNFFYRLRFYYNNPPPISTDVIRSNPYSVKMLRKNIDACAFRMYGHWVKRGDNQNRAALFEHMPRDDWKNISITSKCMMMKS